MKTILLLKDGQSDSLDKLDVVTTSSPEKAVEIAALKIISLAYSKYQSLLATESWLMEMVKDEAPCEIDVIADMSGDDFETLLCIGVINKKGFALQLLNWLSDVDTDFSYAIKTVPEQHILEQLPESDCVFANQMMLTHLYFGMPDESLDGTSLLDETCFDGEVVDLSMTRFEYSFSLREVLNATYDETGNGWYVDGVLLSAHRFA